VFDTVEVDVDTCGTLDRLLFSPLFEVTDVYEGRGVALQQGGPGGDLLLYCASQPREGACFTPDDLSGRQHEGSLVSWLDARWRGDDLEISVLAIGSCAPGFPCAAGPPPCEVDLSLRGAWIAEDDDADLPPTPGPACSAPPSPALPGELVNAEIANPFSEALVASVLGPDGERPIGEIPAFGSFVAAPREEEVIVVNTLDGACVDRFRVERVRYLYTAGVPR
jgi:hypothetical protein